MTRTISRGFLLGEWGGGIIFDCKPGSKIWIVASQRSQNDAVVICHVDASSAVLKNVKFKFFFKSFSCKVLFSKNSCDMNSCNVKLTVSTS